MPLVGELTDAYGRKPFLAAAIALAGLPVVVLLLYLQYGFPLMWYYPAQVCFRVFWCVLVCEGRVVCCVLYLLVHDLTTQRAYMSIHEHA